MKKREVIGSVALVALFLSGCSSYRVVPRPWSIDSATAGADSVSVLQVGDQVRGVAGSDRSFNGVLVSIDDESLVVADTYDREQIERIPVREVRRLEVYQAKANATRNAIAIVVVSSAIVYGVWRATDTDTGVSFDGEANGKTSGGGI